MSVIMDSVVHSLAQTPAST